MGIVYKYDQPTWLTMKMLKDDNREMAKLDAEKHHLAIKCNNNCLKTFFQTSEVA